MHPGVSVPDEQLVEALAINLHQPCSCPDRSGVGVFYFNGSAGNQSRGEMLCLLAMVLVFLRTINPVQPDFFCADRCGER